MSDIKAKIESHLRQCSPHILKRESAVLLKLALAEIIRLEKNTNNQSVHFDESCVDYLNDKG